jgi:hypothetical protein
VGRCCRPARGTDFVQEERHDLKSGDSGPDQREREREDDVRDGKRFVDGVD